MCGLTPNAIATLLHEKRKRSERAFQVWLGATNSLYLDSMWAGCVTHDNDKTAARSADHHHLSIAGKHSRHYVDDDDATQLRQLFDLQRLFGPRIGITRRQRLHRAKLLGIWEVLALPDRLTFLIEDDDAVGLYMYGDKM